MIPSRTTWDVHQRYRIRNDVLAARGDVTRVYRPIDVPEIAQDFQRLAIAPDSDAAVLKFARQWGALGSDVLCHPSLRQGGDPVHWILKQSEEVRYVLASAQMPGTTVFAERVYKALYGVNGHLPLSYRDRDVLTLAARLITYRVQGVQVGVAVDDAGEGFRPEYKFRALIEVIWWHVLKMAGDPELRTCRECRVFFRPDRPNQLYCQRSGRRSLCSGRYHQRKHREREAAERIKASAWRTSFEL